LGSVLALNGKYDEAAENLLHAREICENQGYASFLATVYLELGGLYILQERYQDAYEALLIGSELAANAGHKHLRNKFLQCSGELELNRGNPEEALSVLLEGEALAAELSLEDDLRKLHLLLSQCHEQLGNMGQALAYHKRFYERDQKIHGEKNTRLIASLQFGHQLDKKNKEAEIERLKHVELKKAYHELKSAQDRLVQQEKLASLGRMVTGIAHELQNPLNFVTNFTSLTIDLMDELKEATDDEDKTDIITDIKENLQKISTHGKRASAIVKGMLELKRDGSGAPQPAALSRIIDEFVPLAWNNYRSKCPDLKVQINVDATDKDILARVISMDVGRAIISLLNNALDAVKESADKMGSLYIPTINVSLSKQGSNAVIVISDNGPGVAAGKESLVFEPFFTTKTTGSGNIGLGLSLAHDMIMAQGGQIELESTPEFGATFTILLPLVEAD
jgi:C4-dicarboxylate-specific signal transduction histidine kinase